MMPSFKPVNQRGVASMMVALVLVVLSLLVAYYGANSAIIDQRMAANHVRAKQAFVAAQAGLDRALAYMQVGGVDQNNDNIVDNVPITALAASGTPATYRASYCAENAVNIVCPVAPGNPVCGAPALFTRVQVVSCGWSDDNTAVHKITQLISGTPATPNGGSPPVPLVARGNADLLVGGASVLNYFNDLTVWSGQSFLGQSNTGKTFIRNIATNPSPSSSDSYRNTGNSPACNNPPTGYVCATQGATTGHDVIVGDPNLANLTVDQFFEANFSTTKSNFRDNVAGHRVDLTGTLANANSTSISSLTGKKNMALWVEGNGSIDGTIGTASEPVVLIVNGNLSLGSNAVINGIVFVTGNVSANGTPTVFGSISVGGSATGSGNMKVVYDPFPSKGGSPFSDIGIPTKVNGSWKDW